MGLITYNNYKIEVPISDGANGLIKRKVEVKKLLYDIEHAKVVITVKVIPYAKNPDGSYGNSQVGVLGFTESEISFTADNTTLINVSTGEKYPSNILNDQNDWLEGGIHYNKMVMYEFEYYKQVAATQQVIIDQMLTQVVMLADANGKFG